MVIEKMSIKETGKEVDNKALKGVQANKEVVNKSELFKSPLKEVRDVAPKRKSSLRVEDDGTGRLVPSINNLNENSINFTDKQNSELFQERREAICPYHQFPTEEQLKNLDRKLLIKSDIADGAILRKNLYTPMGNSAVSVSEGFGGNAAHHIVEGNDVSATKSREILSKLEVGINDPENGILLPENPDTSIYKGVVHKTSHTKEYSDYVYNKIKDCSTREELVSKLNEIKYELYKGKLNLQGPNQEINKNIKK